MQEVFEKIIEKIHGQPIESFVDTYGDSELVRAVLDSCCEVVKQAAAEYKENDAFNRVYKKVVSIEQEYAKNGDIENVNRCIRLENLMQYFKEELKGCNNGYNNGWNDIAEKGLPPVGKPLVVTIKDNLQGKANELRYPVYYEKDSMKGGYHWSWRYGDFAYELLPDVSEVVAWQPLPQPYEPKGGQA